jgi:enoyl-CoA hydratase/carnithine racemase
MRFLVATTEVLYSSDGPVATLTFNRPEARNAMTWPMYDALVDACERVDADTNIRAFVLRANGEAFVAGTDIRQFTEFASGDDGIAYERRLDAVVDRLERVVVPTIAQVQGVAAGGGFAIACVCDFRVCTPRAKFGIPVARTLGNCLSVTNYARLVDLIGPARTKDLLYTGRLMDASEAQTAGLVTQLVDADAIDAGVRDLVSTLVSNAPLTIHATKESLRRIAQHRRVPANADDLVAMCYASHDFREGVAAFLAKRKPIFTGQ